MPADTFNGTVPSGQFTGTGAKLEQPRFAGQPVRGFSAIQFGPSKGSCWMMPDNGFGAKYNSPDFLLRIYQITPEPKTASGGSSNVNVGNFIQLRDPDKKIPFLIVNEASTERLLTGSDFDVESFVTAKCSNSQVWSTCQWVNNTPSSTKSGRSTACDIKLSRTPAPASTSK
jgi:hypothetical protein